MNRTRTDSGNIKTLEVGSGVNKEEAGPFVTPAMDLLLWSGKQSNPSPKSLRNSGHNNWYETSDNI